MNDRPVQVKSELRLWHTLLVSAAIHLLLFLPIPFLTLSDVVPAEREVVMKFDLAAPPPTPEPVVPLTPAEEPPVEEAPAPPTEELEPEEVEPEPPDPESLLRLMPYGSRVPTDDLRPAAPNVGFDEPIAPRSVPEEQPLERQEPAVTAESGGEGETEGVRALAEGDDLIEGEPDPGKEVESVARPDQPFDLARSLEQFDRFLREPREGSGRDEGQRENRVPVSLYRAAQVLGAAQRGFEFGDITFESDDWDWSDYSRSLNIELIRGILQQALEIVDSYERWGWENRTRDLRTEVDFRFTVLRNGTVTGVALETPSRVQAVNLTATGGASRMILPPLPEDFPRGSETMHIRMIVRVDVFYFEQWLRSLPLLRTSRPVPE